MIAWPAQIAQQYPLPRDAVPTRPWWRHHGGGWTRRDGREVWVHAGHAPDSDERAMLETRAARLDQTSPLLAPQIRVGQVWAFATSDGWATSCVLTVSLLGGAGMVDFGRGFCALRITPGWVEGDNVHRRPALLVADIHAPLCAPWAPVVQVAAEREISDFDLVHIEDAGFPLCYRCGVPPGRRWRIGGTVRQHILANCPDCLSVAGGRE